MMNTLLTLHINLVKYQKKDFMIETKLFVYLLLNKTLIMNLVKNMHWLEATVINNMNLNYSEKLITIIKKIFKQLPITVIPLFLVKQKKYYFII